MAIDWPLIVNHIRRSSVSNTFGMVRKNANGTPRAHQGWDFEALVGTKTYAISDGTVVFVKHNQGDYGTQLCMSFQHNGTTLYAFYAHLHQVFVGAGQTVKMGTC